jgi:CheY-like chemotaxis protein
MHIVKKQLPSDKVRLLLVDDDAELRHLLALILTQSGYSVRSAVDGLAALAEMDLEVPDILVSDLYMPGMSGFELLAIVENTFPGVYVIAMSSAFSGSSVPPGVAAHCFYEKATDVRHLLGLLAGNMPTALQA